MYHIAQRLFDWWQNGGDDPARLFNPGFVFKGVSKAVTGEDWLYLSKFGVRWTDLELLASFGNHDWGAVVVEGMDPATGLKHRVSWLVRAEKDRIQELIETVQIVE